MLLVTIICCFLGSTLLAQERTVLDSLNQSYKQASADSTKVQALIAIGDYFLHKNLDSTINYYNKALKAIETVGGQEVKKYQPLLYHYTSIAYTSWGRIQEGMEYGQRALSAYEALDMQLEMSDIYMVIGVLYGQMGEVNQGKELLLKAIAIKRELNATEKLGHAYMNLTLLYRDLGMLEEAIASIDSAITRFKAQKFEMGVNRSYQIKGEVHKFAGNNDKALEVYQEALALYRKQATKDIKGEIVLMNSIAGFYRILKEYDRAIAYYQNGLTLLKETDNKELEGLIHHNIGGVYLEQKQYEKALTYYQKGLVFYEAIQHPTGLSRTYRYMGTTYQAVEKYELAIEYYTKATEVLASKKNSDYGDVSKKLASLYYELHLMEKKTKGDEALGMIYLNKAQSFAKESIACPSTNLEASLGRYKTLQKIYQAIGNYQEGLNIANKVIELSDSLFEETKIKTVLDLETQYQTEKKEFDIKILNQEKALQLSENKQQRMLLYGSGTTLIVLIFLLMLLYWFFWQKRKANAALALNNELITRQKNLVDKQNAEKELLLKEIHHRVKNNLQIISSLLDLQSSKIDDDAALSAIADGQSRVQSMALIHHKLYQHEHIATVNFRDYVYQLFDQIMAVLTEESPTLELDIDETIAFDIDTAIPLGLILNELLTNACKYAFESGKKGKLSIRLKKMEQGDYQLELQDNGRGMPADFKLHKARSLGLRLVRRLSKQLMGKASFKNDNGAYFCIQFKDTALRKTID
ncbi:tetratricopeptide repeat protein [Aureispira anguillae]|uniref:Tetratricopeptide repeat protein n=1 Tax=Aureispira anguillae TaxID=2864201 RepID=A0A916DX12_9BACT|nr:tetratricopeptide repeat protein [Aureispira anguillae]BDS15280.1 tetratricopeptide repeat protein [Aureispira anguillae]